jgi:hypothetical protein
MPFEYDVEAFNRKWKNTVAKINGVNGYCYILDGDVGNTVLYAPLEDTAVKKASLADMQYYHFASGWYRSTDKLDKWVCISRLPKKTYKVGISRETHSCAIYTVDKDTIVLHGGIGDPFIKINYDSPENERSVVGCLTRRIFVGSSKVYYLSTPIGFVSNRKISLVNNFFRQEVGDALRGHPWLTLS